MKKLVAVAIFFILGITIISIPACVCNGVTTYGGEAGEWTGNVRIEGKNDTIWNGQVTIGSTSITALNESSGEMETYYIDHPSALGSLDESSKQGGFSYEVTYYPSWGAFLVTSIGDDSDWWHYWVDYDLPMVCAGTYELTEDNSDVLWGYLENWYAHALRISLDNSIVKKNEQFTVSVFNETMAPVKDAIVYVNSETYMTDENGNVIVQIANKGTYDIYAEKDDYVRSDNELVQVKKGKGKMVGLDGVSISAIIQKIINRFPLMEPLLIHQF